MKDEEYAQSVVAAQNYLREGGTDVEGIFCAACLPHAREYWISRSELLGKILSEARTRLERHRRSFFQSAKARSNLRVVSHESAERA